MHRTLTALALVLALPAHAADMAAHRALYELKKSATGNDSVSEAGGTMAYEVRDACDGWAVRQRLQLDITNVEGQQIRMVSDYLTYEAKDGGKFRFHLHQTTDDAVTSEIEGEAARNPDGTGTVEFTKPDGKTATLPAGTLFPMAHTIALLAGAARNQKTEALPLFDGTSDDGAQDTSVTVLSKLPAGPNPFPVLANRPSVRVAIAFFDQGKDMPTPQFQQTLRYWDDGIADGLRMDFGDFSVDGALQTLEPLPSGC